MKTFIPLFFSFILLISCSKEKKESTMVNKSTPNQIVLIFNDFPVPYSISLNDTKGKAYTPAKPELRYYDEHLLQRTINPIAGTSDTIVIPCQQGIIEFQHSVKGIDNFDYLFQKGDTVVFTYKEKIPNAKVINRRISDFETNYDLKQREFVCDNDYTALTKVTVPFMFITYNTNYIGKEGERSGIPGQLDKIKTNAQARFQEEIEIEKSFLDSLFDRSLLSNQAYQWLTQKLEMKKYTEKAYNDLLNRKEIKLIISEDLDSLLSYHAYRNLVATISSAKYDRKIKRIISSNANLPDFHIVYDSILKSNLFSPKTKEILLLEASNQLIQNSGATAVAAHLNKLNNDIRDTSLVSFLVNKYKLQDQISHDLHLIDRAGNKTTLLTYIKENPDKVVYVDIWASWCAPCIAEFPSSKKLNQRFTGKNVVFMYLSIDNDSTKWFKSCDKYELPKQSSFLVENVKTSKFLEKLDFNSIPRYLVFNKNGELEYKDAPRPSDERTTQMLEDLLARKP